MEATQVIRIGETSPRVPERTSQRRIGGRPARPARSTSTALRFDPLLAFETWEQLGARIARYATGTSWWLGDWLAFGQEKYGRRYKSAIAATGLDYQTLRNYAVVARRFPFHRRRADLTFQHHAELCALSDEAQELWLDRATHHGWSKAELRRRLRGAASPPRAREAGTGLRLSIDEASVRRWQRAAARSGEELEAWVICALDAAALVALDEGS
jgi:hypothetical protein